MRKNKGVASLLTPLGERLGEAREPLCPRPVMARREWISLDGEWELCYDGGEVKVRVPYPPQSALSGVGFDPGNRYTYKRKFTLGDLCGRVAVIHFGAVDTHAEVRLNGRLLGSHSGGYLPFSFELCGLNEGENLLEVSVFDDLDPDFAYGKQRKNRGGMWYTPISGIWQSVWIDIVPKCHIEALELTPSLDSVRIRVKGGEAQKRLTLEGGDVYEFEGDEFTLAVPNPENWTPENPKLYNFTIECGEDRVSSYFALRTIEAKGGELLLNGKPYYFHGLLDQGYYSDGIYTPAAPEGYEEDLLLAKRLGFNMVRKHAKVEPEIFYYYCDKLGVAVFQDFVNSGKYNFFIDTALPTVGLKRGIRKSAGERRKRIFEADGRDMLAFLYNHPSVCCYTIFNEGWGQYDADRLYKEMKALDPTRIFDTTSGWFFESESDVDSHHVYFKKVKLEKRDKPLVLSEFGGYSHKVEGHSYNLDKNYGYKFFGDAESLDKALKNLYLEEIVPAVRAGLTASVLTQLSDVEDETNGLVTYDRRVVKVKEETMTEIRRVIDGAFSERMEK